jgi:hypothetical protein
LTRRFSLPAGEQDRSAARPERDRSPLPHVSTTTSAMREERRSQRGTPLFAKLTRAEQSSLPSRASSTASEITADDSSCPPRRPSKEKESEASFLPPLESRSSSKESVLVLPIPSLKRRDSNANRNAGWHLDCGS